MRKLKERKEGNIVIIIIINFIYFYELSNKNKAYFQKQINTNTVPSLNQDHTFYKLSGWLYIYNYITIEQNTGFHGNRK